MTRKSILLWFSFIGSWIIEQMGGWTIPVQFFFWCVVIDIFSGYIVGGVFNNSPNTPNGKLSSRFMFKGIVRKFMYICMIILARQMDLLLEFNYISNGLILGLIVLDMTSILENVALMGINLPNVLKDSLEILSKEAVKRRMEK